MYGEPVFGTVTVENPVALTTHGKVMGENREGIAVFRGIPYGGSCEGERRFLPPVPAEDWEGIRDCTENGPIPVQERGSIQTWEDQGPAFHGGRKEVFKVDHEVMSESCLVVNVLTPGVDDKKRPVMFYIHGGGYAVGTGALVLGADKVCREQDLVVVSVNHRLGPFGYLYLGGFDKKYEKSGIAGLLDVVLALQWVRQNIANFGGDPEKVTIVGESGGGNKVTALLSMDITEGLFRAAVIESGSSGNHHFTKEEGHQIACDCLDKLKLDHSSYKKLLELPTMDILSLIKVFDHESRAFSPVPDGEIMPTKDRGKYYIAPWARKINIIIGSCDEETAVWCHERDFNITEDNIRQKLISPKQCEVDAQPICLCTEENVDRVLAAVKKMRKRSEDANHMFQKVASLAGTGGRMIRHTLGYAEMGCENLYQYLVTWDSHHPLYPQYKFAWHTATLPLHMRVVWQPEDEALSKDFCQAISAFVRTGCPATDKFKWEKFTKENRETMMIDGYYYMENDPQKELREALENK